jgi:GTP-binding protein
MAGSEGRDPYADYLQINEEIRRYKQNLERRPQIIVANKMDLPEAEEQLALFREQIGEEVPIYPISAVSRQGIQPLLYAIADTLDRVEVTPIISDDSASEETVVYQSKAEEPAFTIRRENETYVVEGYRIEKLIKMTNFRFHDSLMRFANTIKQMGVEDALRKRGAKEGDTVRIGEMEFELSDGMDIED